MDYNKHYEQLIATRNIKIEDTSTICHKHHIIPRYMKGNNDSNNIVRLSIKDHAFAHWLLYKIHRNIEDKIAYKMLSGKTTESEKLRRILALSKLPIEKMSERMKICNPLFDPKNVQKALETKKRKYNGKFFSDKGLEAVRKSCSRGNQHSPEAIQKRIQSQLKTCKKLGKEGRSQKYGRHNEANSNYGIKRPGNLAGNFGTSKGYYIIHTLDGNKLEFKSLRKAMDYGFDEATLKRNRNTGKPIQFRRWKGYIVEYIENANYGKNWKTKQQFYGQ